MSIKRFVKLLIKGVPREGARPRASDSLARTAKDAIHVRGGGGQSGGFISSSATYDHIEKGHEDYEKSFKRDKSS